MSAALFITHRTEPGRRADVERVWRQHMADAIAANEGHEFYRYCFADDDPDVIVVYQQYADAGAAAAFVESAAYRAYLDAVEPLLSGPPVVVTATPRWQK